MAFTVNTLTLVLLAVLLVATTADLRLQEPAQLAGRGQEVDVLLDTNRAKSRIQQPPHQQQQKLPQKSWDHIGQQQHLQQPARQAVGTAPAPAPPQPGERSGGAARHSENMEAALKLRKEEIRRVQEEAAKQKEQAEQRQNQHHWEQQQQQQQPVQQMQQRNNFGNVENVNQSGQQPRQQQPQGPGEEQKYPVPTKRPYPVPTPKSQEDIHIPHGAFGEDGNVRSGERIGPGAANPAEVQAHVVEVAPMPTAQPESGVKVPGLIQNVVGVEGVKRAENNNPMNVFPQNNNPVNVFPQNNPPVNVFPQNNPPVNVFPQGQPQRTVGGLQINWDWDDFSISFENYGAAEMKVRRAPHPTTGEPWPLPQYYTKKEKTIFTLDPNFSFIVTGNITCDIMEQAMKRYKVRIVEDAVQDMYDNLQNAEGTHLEAPEPKYNTQQFRAAPTITKIAIKVRRPCSVFPNLKSDESYDLVVKKGAAYIWANEVWGLLRGLETLSQVVWRGVDHRLYVKESIISDYPRFPHRGILIDTSRHYVFKEVILDMLDAMEMNKMNVFHWHIVDDQSFPYQSQLYPELSEKGAFHPTFIYSHKDIADIIEYARLRGIRVMPEFDSPGHTYSWGLSKPDLLTQCYSGMTPIKGYLGPIDPVRNSTYSFLKNLFGEIMGVFKDDFLHLGGDEVPLGCWQSNPDVIKFGDQISRQADHAGRSQQSFFDTTSPNIRLVYEYYVNRLMKDIKDSGMSRENGVRFVMWQEVMNNDLKLPNDTLIQVWMGDMADVSRAISLGYDVIYSTCWYLDHVEYGVKWPKYYQCDPVDTSYGYTIDEKKVKGGEACLWAEYIDSENLMQVTWPRTSAVAERLWSSKETRSLDAAGERLTEHRCRMLRRGLSVGQISGPDYCYRRGVSRGRHSGSGCQGDGCRPVADVKDDTVSRLKGSNSNCSWVFHVSSNVTMLAVVAVIAFVVLVGLTRTSSRLYQFRVCKNRTILLVFLAVIFIYVMCYTTMWMQVSSGSLPATRTSSDAAGTSSS